MSGAELGLLAVVVLVDTLCCIRYSRRCYQAGLRAGKVLGRASVLYPGMYK